MAELKITRGHSCGPCQHRKIRCNGQSPCAYCIKTGKDCVRLPRSIRTTNNHTGRTAQERFPSQNSSSTAKGQVVVSGDQRRYVEDNKLWSSLGNEMAKKDPNPTPSSIPMPSRVELPSTNINLIFGHKLDSPFMLYPSAIQSFRLWQVFTTNVHPLTKILHAPTVQQELIQGLSEPDSIHGPTEALIFSIYLVTVVSLTDEECRSQLGEPREKHLARYCYATEAALSRVDFLRSTNLKVLQAFTFYLLSLRHLCDHDILWLLTGLATRMGQRMGLHRESSLKDLPPFEAELRRRVWWQIVILDGRTAQLTGASMNPGIQLYGDTKQPLGVNDDYLVPSMSVLPRPSPVTTEMVFCSVRIEIGVWMIEQKCLLDFATSPERRIKFLKSIDELESHIEEKYLRAINKDIPLNLLTTYLARSAVCQLRLSVYHPNHQPERTSELDGEQMDMLLENSLEVIRYDILSHSTGSLQRFLWHIANFFPFETFVLLISALSSRAGGQIVDVAWHVINQVYEHHPCFITDSNDSLYRALGNLTLRAWQQRIAASRNVGMELPLEPPCIGQLARQRTKISRNAQSKPQVPTPASHGQDVAMPGFEEEMTEMTKGIDMDWNFWQELLDGNSRESQECFPFSSFMNKA
ncbi:fungal-specific transcription factor domain-containing protein [Colletotrichum godetiae]|uniref:Fungal-specific transcription factor domain-containing protein n=1 Tax=Colletotrichum godetiae TaxID=1209918 RepID=A0AAJ0EY32_9PEZI|nr:fungal-specific transcription factor domain-containing protein [Colletotrichum godetiae]KAK1675774.1 fungal-specific transcription factor domain-containing protein [Colletotrichum godetiae]